MEDKKSFSETLEAFLAGKGFYIVLLLCAALIATSIWLMTDRSRADVAAQSRESEIAAETAELPSAAPAGAETESRPESLLPSVPVMGLEELPNESVGLPFEPGAPALVEPMPAPEEEAADADSESGWFIWPVSGEVLRPYSVETLRYDPTMADWRTHAGMDLRAEVGSEVLAVTGGTVSAVYADPMLGTVVEIGHADGLVSVYANLDPETEVAVGRAVRTGELIGRVGASAISESGESSHLHLAMRRNGVSADPADYLPER